VAAIALVCFAVFVGGIRWWRGSAGRGPTAPRISLPLGPEDVAASTTVRSTTATAVAGAGGVTERGKRRVRVEVKAVRHVWLRAEVDGRELVARLVRAGENFEFKGANDVVLRAGDAGALLMSVDGGAPAAFGGAGAVLTRRVAADPSPSPQRQAPSQATAAPPGSSTAARPLLPRPDAHALPTPVSLPQSHTITPDRRIDPPEQSQAASETVRAAPAPTAPGGSDEGDVLRAHEAYFEALRRGDQGQVGRLAADGFSVTGGPAADEAGVPYEITLRNASVEIRGVGAVVSGTASQRINGPDGQFLRHQPLLFSEVWIRRDGQWQLMNVRLMSQGAAR
jgi:hypothetical protein